MTHAQNHTPKICFKSQPILQNDQQAKYPKCRRSSTIHFTPTINITARNSKPRATAALKTITVSPANNIYDPQNNWKISRKRQHENPEQLKPHMAKKISEGNIDDLTLPAEKQDTKHCLTVQKSREQNMNTVNSRFVTNHLYSLTPAFNKSKIGEKAPAVYEPSTTYHQLAVSKVPFIEKFT